jgi:hypothetical protein
MAFLDAGRSTCMRTLVRNLRKVQMVEKLDGGNGDE